ncbi:hypothetical protein BWQ96_05492 [Gracilariopsis chorda]|uniref:Transcription and mRNA export factor ENY2 n=1 Tax=Gracilariopsis chorda TaxID=448386 RepID=A0A2V3IRK7_9FLOR|nr:hypothetical protein BWQ96_05492 [Gracilariopsis chorda]|eukprot:PXF44733.1 hypothetical protein BWQ96_05492 [Gracilariopsis chorda]
MKSVSENNTAADRVARQVLEHLQESGERDRIKEWLINDLESKGWTAMLFKRAEEICSAQSQDPKFGATSGKPPSVDAPHSMQGDDLTVRNIASQLSKEAMESVPEAVRSKLMQEVLDATREFVARENFESPVKKESK